ncbi:MAG: sugar ABC transporter permease, partial [Microbacterium sp.]|nr:sugar ABC transporter permease [Microbacterium sp.]
MSSYPFGARAPMRITFSLGLVVLAVFALLPAVAVFVISFTDIRGLPGIPVNWVGFDNYERFFSAAKIGYNLNALKNTLIYAVVSTVAINLLGLAIAVLLNQKLRGRTFSRAVVFLPTILGVTVIGLIWSLFFNPSAGPAASIWSWFGADSAFFGDPNLALALVIFVQIWAGLGIAVVIYLAGLQAIPEELQEAASIDGASGGQRMRLITVPLLAPSITANVLLAIVGSLQSYQLAYVLTGPNNPATQLLSLAIFAQGFGGS